VRYERRAHAAKSTADYTFHQLIPYIGNKRKLLHLIGRALSATDLDPARSTFLDLFAGSSVVSRYAKRLGFRVLANDWEPYSEVLSRCAIEANAPPRYPGGRTYEQVIDALNALPPHEGWVTTHLCPPDDEAFDVARDRMFYMRKNGMRLDAIREQIAAWESQGSLTPVQRDCLIAPLLYQASYTSNTSGVFKGFHRTVSHRRRPPAAPGGLS
jgi:adenine-specific DNA-methyltransferase